MAPISYKANDILFMSVQKDIWESTNDLYTAHQLRDAVRAVVTGNIERLYKVNEPNES